MLVYNVLKRFHIIEILYRPFNKTYLYYQEEIIERPSRYKDVFDKNNKIIYCTGKKLREIFKQ